MSGLIHTRVCELYLWQARSLKLHKNNRIHGMAVSNAEVVCCGLRLWTAVLTYVRLTVCVQSTDGSRSARVSRPASATQLHDVTSSGQSVHLSVSVFVCFCLLSALCM